MDAKIFALDDRVGLYKDRGESNYTGAVDKVGQIKDHRPFMLTDTPTDRPGGHQNEGMDADSISSASSTDTCSDSDGKDFRTEDVVALPFSQPACLQGDINVEGEGNQVHIGHKYYNVWPTPKPTLDPLPDAAHVAAHVAPPTPEGSLLKKFIRWPHIVWPIGASAATVTAFVIIFLVHYETEPSIETLPNGVRFARRAVWNARPPKQPPTRLRTAVQTIMVCHTGAQQCSQTEECIKTVNGIQHLHMYATDNVYDDIGYNFLVGGDGVVYEGRGWDSVGAFLKGWNDKAIGVAIIGNFDARMPGPDQTEMLRKFIAWAVELGKVREEDYWLLGPCQVYPVNSPGLCFMEELKTWDHWQDRFAAPASCKGKVIVPPPGGFCKNTN